MPATVSDIQNPLSFVTTSVWSSQNMLTHHVIDNAVSLDGAKLLVSYIEEYAKTT